MLLYMFADLVNKYSVPCRLITAAPGQYVAGEYIVGSEIVKDVQAAIISMTNRTIYESGGKLTSADRQMYILKANDPIDLDDDQTWYLEHMGKVYKIEEASLYAEDYADFNNYTLRRVESFHAR